jgi:hypothetical protein
MTIPAATRNAMTAVSTPQRPPNVVILTHGWTGSSVFSALFGRAGLWLGDQTMLKPDYDTFENAELVDLNRLILSKLLPELNHEHRFDPRDVAAAGAGTLPDQALRAFVAKCEDHGPWIWKDPRLTWTMRTWAPLLDLNRTRFLVLTREPLQAWASANLRRHVQSYRFTHQYNDGITQSNLRFLTENGLPCLKLSFEDLLMDPDGTLQRLNQHFDMALTRADLQAVCRLPLHRKSRTWRDCIVAGLIFLKNFSERDGRGRQIAAPQAANQPPSELPASR